MVEAVEATGGAVDGVEMSTDELQRWRRESGACIEIMRTRYTVRGDVQLTNGAELGRAAASVRHGKLRISLRERVAAARCGRVHDAARCNQACSLTVPCVWRDGRCRRTSTPGVWLWWQSVVGGNRCKRPRSSETS